jgi:hypothetical protein
MPATPAASVYQSCIRWVRDPNLKERLEKAAESVASADLHYRRAGTAGGCGGLPCADFELADVTAKEMAWLYDNKMVDKKARAVGYTKPSGRPARRGGVRCAVTGT